MLVWNLVEQSVLGTLSLIAIRGILIGNVLRLILFSPGGVQRTIRLTDVLGMRPSLVLETLTAALLVVSFLTLRLSLALGLVRLVLGLLVLVLSNVASLASGTGVALVVGDPVRRKTKRKKGLHVFLRDRNARLATH